MPDSVAGVVIAIALVLPGFVIAELSVVGRARAQTSDLELVLRALFYALLLHLVAAPWTKQVVDEIGPISNWTDHLKVLVPYVAVVLVAAPVALGSALGAYLRSVERREQRPGTIYSMLGARDAGSGWDSIFQRLSPQGTWLIVELKNGELIGGMHGKHSAVGQTPSPHDLYIQEVWTVDSAGIEPNLKWRIEPTRGLFVSADEIRSIRVLNPPYVAVKSTKP